MADEKALDKIDVTGELKTLSPIEKKSIELLERAKSLTVEDKVTYLEAKKLKREFVSHRTDTKNLRLTFTRKLDSVKAQFIKKEDEVLEPSIAGEALVKQQIEDWEKAEAERKAAEEKRIEDICQGLTDVLVGLKRKESTIEDVKRARAALKMERGLLDANDRNKKAIKDTVAHITEKLDEIEQFIIDRIEQERVAEEQRKEQERLDAERKKLEEEKAAQEAANFAANAPLEKQNLERTTTVMEPAKGNVVDVKTPETSIPATPPPYGLTPVAAAAESKGFEQVEWRFTVAAELTKEELTDISTSILCGETSGYVNRESK